MRRGVLWCLFAALLVCATMRADAESRTSQRLALVIGNAGYADQKLPTATNDAGLVAQSLAQAGFDVTAMGDVDAPTLRKTMDMFVGKVREAGGRPIVFVYLSGYGVQYAGENYLVPIGANIRRQADVPGQAVTLTDLQRSIEALPATARLFVYDLGRETSFPKGEAVPLAAGLTLQRASPGSLYAFNTAPDTAAPWADILPYGLYARALAEALHTPGMTLKALFTRVRLRVATISNGAVVPWNDTNIDPAVKLVLGDETPGASGAPSDPYWSAIAEDTPAAYQSFLRVAPADALAARLKHRAAIRLEASTWSESVRADVPPAYWTYMRRYPRSPHYLDVRRRLAAIHAGLEPPPRFDLYPFAGLPAPTPDELQALDRPDAENSIVQPPVPEAMLPPAPPEVYVELAPPPLVPTGVLPVPTPFLVGANRVSLEVPGRVEQPFVPGLGAVLIESRLLGTAAAMSLSTEVGLLTRTVTSSRQGERRYVETDAADEVISQASVTRTDAGEVTIVQTGVDGAEIMRIVMRTDALGRTSTIVSNGAGQRVAETRMDRQGVVKDLIREPATLDQGAFVLPAIDPAPEPASPKIATPNTATPLKPIPRPKPAAPKPRDPKSTPTPPTPSAAQPTPSPGQPSPTPKTPRRAKVHSEPANPTPVPRAPPPSAPQPEMHETQSTPAPAEGSGKTPAEPARDAPLPSDPPKPEPRPNVAAVTPAPIPLPVPRPASLRRRHSRH